MTTTRTICARERFRKQHHNYYIKVSLKIIIGLSSVFLVKSIHHIIIRDRLGGGGGGGGGSAKDDIPCALRYAENQIRRLVMVRHVSPFDSSSVSGEYVFLIVDVCCCC